MKRRLFFGIVIPSVSDPVSQDDEGGGGGQQLRDSRWRQTVQRPPTREEVPFIEGGVGAPSKVSRNEPGIDAQGRTKQETGQTAAQPVTQQRQKEEKDTFVVLGAPDLSEARQQQAQESRECRTGDSPGRLLRGLPGR